MIYIQDQEWACLEKTAVKVMLKESLALWLNKNQFLPDGRTREKSNTLYAQSCNLTSTL